jgi:hypothetical protein
MKGRISTGVMLVTVLALVLMALAACVSQSPDGALHVVVDNAAEVGSQEFGAAASGLTSYSIPCYREQGGTAFVGESGCTFDVKSGAAVSLASGASLTMASGSTATFAVQPTLQDGLTLQGQLNLRAGTSITVTNSAPFTATASWQPIVAAGAVTPTITIPSLGHVVCVQNTGTNVITIADASNQVLASTFAMGQYDVLCGRSDGTRFIEMNRSNN